VEHITHVISYDVPNVAEDYVHRIGRTGRAEAEGDAFVLVSPTEEQYLAKIERHIGQRLPRVTLPDFDYSQAGAQRSDKPAQRGGRQGGRSSGPPSRGRSGSGGSSGGPPRGRPASGPAGGASGGPPRSRPASGTADGAHKPSDKPPQYRPSRKDHGRP
jgi:ATP-dependent RNA helicase RhlE